MSEIQLNEAFLAKTAGWEVIKSARSLLASGKVLSSSWKPPVLNGVVQADETSYRAGLVIKDSINIDNLCTCRQSRQWGTICSHSVAVALHALKPAAATEPKAAPATNPGGAGRSTAGGSGIVPGTPSPRTKDPVRLRRDERGEPLELQVILSPNLRESFDRGRVTVVLEGIRGRQRMPVDAWIRGGGSVRLTAEDERILAAAELLAGGDSPGMMQVGAHDFLELLPAMAGHPRVTLGRGQTLSIHAEPWVPKLKAQLEPNGEILLSLKALGKPSQPLRDGDHLWTLEGTDLRRCDLSPEWRGVFDAPIRIARPQVPLFLSQALPRLTAAGLEANFRTEDFTLEPQAPRFILELAGGLAQLTGTLHCRYGSRILPVGTSAAGDAGWMPDPTNPRRYATRDPASEHQAMMRLRRAGFSGPDAKASWRLDGQDRVMAFFARDYPRIEKEWEVSLEERLDRSTRTNLDRITPQLRVVPSGEQWFDFEVSYSTAGGERLSAADIQQLLHGNGCKRLRNGKWAVLDTGAVEGIQDTLLDCAPSQRVTDTATSYRMARSQAGYLSASLEARNLAIQAPSSWKERARQQTGQATWNCPPLGPLEDVLRDYQKLGVGWLQFLRSNGFGGLLADEMGLGKTLQVLAHIDAAVESTPATSRLPSLVVCPTSLVFNWAAEAAKFTPRLRILTIQGQARDSGFQKIAENDLVITSYALLRRDIDRYLGVEFDTVILDEAQHIKNRQTQNAQAVKALRSQHRLVLTGTPLENSILDLWSIFDFLMPGYLGTAQDFRDRYEIPIARERDAGTMSKLSRRVRPFMLRRLKMEVARDLPDRLEQVVYCDLTQAQSEAYQQLLSATRKEVLEATGPQGLARSRMLVLTALLRLRQVCCDLRLLAKPESDEPTPDERPDGQESRPAQAVADPSGKVQAFGELLDEVIDGGHRVLVFSQFTSMLGLLREELDRRDTKHCYLDGSTVHRGDVVRQFQQESDIPVFLISLKAGGVGLNLTGADTVIHFDPWWNPAVEDQATDRSHRIGQQRVVTSYKLIARGTIEEKILNLQRRKRELTAAALTGEEALTDQLTWEEIQDLLG